MKNHIMYKLKLFIILLTIGPIYGYAHPCPLKQSSFAHQSHYPYSGYHGTNYCHIYNNTLNAIHKAEELKIYSTVGENEQYLLPIKNSAKYLLIYMKEDSVISEKIVNAIKNLNQKIDLGRPCFNELILRNEESFEAIVSLLSTREYLADVID